MNYEREDNALYAAVFLCTLTIFRYCLGVAHFSMLQALETLIFSYLFFCVLILIPP